MPSLLERIKQQIAGKGITQMPSERERQKVRKIVQTNRFDDTAFQRARRTDKINEQVVDLLDGSEEDERPAFEQAPELVEALFQLAYKAAPELTPQRRLARDLIVGSKIAQEVEKNPRLTELHEFTAGDTMTSVVAVEAMMPVVHEILKRVGQQSKPNEPGQGGGQGQQGQGGGGGGNGQPQPGQNGGGQGQGQGHDGQNPQPGQNGGGGGQGQPDPNQQGQQGQDPAGGGQPDPNQTPGQDEGAGQGDGGGDQDEGNVPPPIEERDAEEGYANEDVDLTENALDEEFQRQQEEERQREAEEAAWEDAWDQIMDEVDLERHVERALEAAEREVEELDDLRKNIGLADGEWAVMSPDERIALVEKLRTPEMRDLATIIGRMRRFALGVKASRVINVNHEAYDVELGNDLKRVLRQQLALLAHPGTRLEFYRRYVDKELLQFKMRGTEEVAKGPIVMLVDKSGSMNGQPFHWALAVCEALRQFAAEDDRDLEVVFFGNNSDRTRFSFLKGKAPFEKIMAMLGTIANGGTQFDGILTEGLEKATEAFDGEGKGKADIVFITDGQAHLSEDWINDFNAERERVGVRVYSVYIGGAYDMSGRTGPLGLLEQISDATIPVSELTPAAVEEVFAKV